MKNIKEINVDGERLFIKKSKLGTRIVYPIKVDGKINWKNLLIGGSWGNLIKLIFIISALLFIAFSYKHDMNNCINYAMDLCRVEILNGSQIVIFP